MVALDPADISSCIPDFQRLQVKTADDFSVLVRAGISFVKGDITLHFQVVEKVSPISAKIKVNGTGIGSTVEMDIVLAISIEGDGSSMKWTADAKIRGKIASFGQKVLEAQAERIIRQLFDCLRAKLEAT